MDTERTAVRRHVQSFENLNQKRRARPSGFGKMTPKEWSVFAYRHNGPPSKAVRGFDRMDKACGDIVDPLVRILTDSIRASSVVSRVDIV